MVGMLSKMLVFEVSDKKCQTFNDFNQTISGKWTNHDRILGKPKSEFLGADLRTISFTMHLDACLGVKPRAMLDLLERMVEHGRSMPLVIGNKRVGKNCWKILEISEAWNVIMNKGELVQADVDVKMEESL